MENNLRPLSVPRVEAYNLKLACLSKVDLSLVIINAALSPMQEKTVRSVESAPGINSSTLKSRAGASSPTNKGLINDKLKRHGIMLVSIPSLKPFTPWHWFLVTRSSVILLNKEGVAYE